MYKHAIGMYKLLVMLMGQTQTMPYVYLCRASYIHARQPESNVNRSIGIVWFDTEAFSNCQNLSSR